MSPAIHTTSEGHAHTQSRRAARPRGSGSEHTVLVTQTLTLPALPVRAARIIFGGRPLLRAVHHPWCTDPQSRVARGRPDRAQAWPYALAHLTAPSREPSTAAHAPLPALATFVSLCTDSSDTLPVRRFGWSLAGERSRGIGRGREGDASSERLWTLVVGDAVQGLSWRDTPSPASAERLMSLRSRTCFIAKAMLASSRAYVASM